ncbi:hypothetical protein E2C01_023910 [Portunus trituberculatus]|uniref:Uncharacterized protein n=1 Tax=Portunus trituberculatus TaxID=210409 RepID=A0A5B7E9D3_PORTR|nr:hypothetical protein [Portunus trituberculatus]
MEMLARGVSVGVAGVVTSGGACKGSKIPPLWRKTGVGTVSSHSISESDGKVTPSPTYHSSRCTNSTGGTSKLTLSSTQSLELSDDIVVIYCGAVTMEFMPRLMNGVADAGTLFGRQRMVGIRINGSHTAESVTLQDACDRWRLLPPHRYDRRCRMMTSLVCIYEES